MPAQRPRLTTSGPLLQGSCELHIVGTHEVVSVPDPTGAMQRLLRLADGSRTRAEIFTVLAIGYPALGERNFEEALCELEDAGVLEDGASRSPRQQRPAARRDARVQSLFGGSARVM